MDTKDVLRWLRALGEVVELHFVPFELRVCHFERGGIWGWGFIVKTNILPKVVIVLHGPKYKEKNQLQLHLAIL